MLEVEFRSGHSKGFLRLFAVSDLKPDSKYAGYSNLGTLKGSIVSGPWG